MGWELHPANTAFAEFAKEWDRLNRELANLPKYFNRAEEEMSWGAQ
jgi:hypothetical protein